MHLKGCDVVFPGAMAHHFRANIVGFPAFNYAICLARKRGGMERSSGWSGVVNVQETSLEGVG